MCLWVSDKGKYGKIIIFFASFLHGQLLAKLWRTGGSGSGSRFRVLMAKN
jgi:hypothetical protein